MEIVSYLLGKQSGGSEPTGEIEITQNGVHNVAGYATANVEVEPDLETKSVTITQNKTTTITPTQGKDGMSSVEVTTNVSPDMSDYFTSTIEIAGSNQAPGIIYLVKKIPDNLTINIQNLSYMFYKCYYLTTAPLLDTSNVTNTRNMFQSCLALTSIPQYDLSKSTSVIQMFWDCSKLENVPVFTLTAMQYCAEWFKSCSKLTNESLNNIMASLLTATSYTGTKTLAYIGLTSTQATTCTGLSNWSALQSAGWTTGY